MNSIKRPPPPPPPVVEKIVEKVIIEKSSDVDLDAIRRIILEKKRDELGRQVCSCLMKLSNLSRALKAYIFNDFVCSRHIFYFQQRITADKQAQLSEVERLVNAKVEDIEALLKVWMTQLGPIYRVPYAYFSPNKFNA